MMDRLILTEARVQFGASIYDGYALVWEYEGELGGYIGETWKESSALQEVSPTSEDYEAWLWDSTAFKFDPDYKDPFFMWDSKTKAANALRAVKAALKAHALKKPLPEWAQMALVNGWKAPRGWKPSGT